MNGECHEHGISSGEVHKNHFLVINNQVRIIVESCKSHFLVTKSLLPAGSTFVQEFSYSIIVFAAFGMDLGIDTFFTGTLGEFFYVMLCTLHRKLGLVR